MEELVIVGSGCAGMSAAIYAARAGMNPLVLEGDRPGGLITTTSDVENFPSYPEGINGFELVWRMRQQAEKFGARIEGASVKSVDFSDANRKILKLDGGKSIEAKKIVIAVGSSPRLTGVKGEAELYGGGGVSACATCDGAFYRGQPVVVIGGGDSACEEALFLTRFCSKVYLVHRRDEFRASKIMADRVVSNDKIERVMSCVPEEIEAGKDGKCEAIKVRGVKTGEIRRIECKCVFVAIGHVPNTGSFRGSVEMDSEGYIVPREGSLVETDIDGVYVAGDCSDKKFRQAITASAMGCMAAIIASQKQ